MLLLVNPEIDLGTARKVSFQQLADNVLSVVNEDASSNLRDSRDWPLEWWDTIVDYTANGPYFWTGKGFGVNLANDDGFQVLADESLRAPHNAHLAILADAGAVELRRCWLTAGWRDSHEGAPTGTVAAQAWNFSKGQVATTNRFARSITAICFASGTFT